MLQTEHLVLATANPDLTLREIAAPADDQAFFAAFNDSRDDIERTDPGAAAGKFLTIEAAAAARYEAQITGRLRMGGWLDGNYVATFTAKEPIQNGVEIGYWVRTRFNGQGIATL